MNERQVAMAESTCGARTLGPLPATGPGSSGALFSIEELSRVALERCATARCAVATMGALASQYGFFAQDREYEDSAEVGCFSWFISLSIYALYAPLFPSPPPKKLEAEVSAARAVFSLIG